MNNSDKKQNNFSIVSNADFVKTISSKEVLLFILRNNNGIIAQITNFGGRIIGLWTPDKNDNFKDIVLGYNTIDGFLKSNENYFGATIGRYGNRIANGEFTLEGITYHLDKNNNGNCLHGGKSGFHNVVWEVISCSKNELLMTYLSKDGEGGFPGNLNVTIRYELTDENELVIQYSAITDKATPVNLTHHSFFNLAGEGRGTVLNHLVQINASHFTPVNENMIPLGKLENVSNTPFDFREFHSIGSRIDNENEQLKLGSGYDHNFVIDGSGLRIVAKVIEPESERTMEVITDEPGIQFYTGNFLNGSDIGKAGLPYLKRGAFCIETQHYPDSPNKPEFPSTILYPGEKYSSACIYKFGVI